jgi:tetratricopeptide (TPR) repeat protein
VRALAVLLALATPVAAAPRRRPPAPEGRDPRQERAARGHFDRAERAFNLGRFDEALTEYQSAYEALPLPAFVFNIAQCHRNLGNLEKAVFFYQRYLSLQPDAPNRAVVEDLITEQSRTLEQRRAAEAATFAPAEAPPAPAPAPVVEAPAPERPLELPPEPPAPPPSHRRWWILGAAGAALLGGAAILVLRGGPQMPTGALGSIDAR